MNIVIEARAEFAGNSKKRITIACRSTTVSHFWALRIPLRDNAAIKNARNENIRKDDKKDSAIHHSKTNRTGLNPEKAPVFQRVSSELISK